MAIEKLRTDFKDDVINTTASSKRRYNMITNSDGTISLEDVTTYVQVGDNYGAAEINKANASVNGLIDKTSNINNTADVDKRVAYAATAGTANTAGSVSGDFILRNHAALSFTNNICSISDSRITADSLADVYFTEESISIAEKAIISVETYLGRVELTAGRTPTGTISATIRIRVV